MKKLLLVFAILPVLLFAQTRKQRKALEAQRKADQQVIGNFKNHTQFFTDKATQNLAASQKDQQALDYISEQFKAIGLQPKGASQYVQQYLIDDGKQIQPGTSLKVNGTVLAIKKDYFPLAFSASKKVEGMPAMALREKGVPWFADVKEWMEENAKSDSDINKIILKEANRAALKGSTALFLYNSSNVSDNIHFNKRDKTASVSIPVVYITPEGYGKYFTDQSQVLDIELNIALKEATKKVSTIIGFLDNHASSNILVATPYDRHSPDEIETVAIADSSDKDVITGRSMLIELARMLSKSKAKNNNYTFVGYSSDDSVSNHSKWFNNPSITSNANYLINLDKVGRYNDDKNLVVSAYGLSPEIVQTIKSLADTNLEVTIDSVHLSGKAAIATPVKIPVLNFFTAAVSGDAQAQPTNINYQGELNIARLIYRFIETTDSKGKLAFTQNTESSIINNVLPALSKKL